MSHASIGKFKKREIFELTDGTHRLEKNLYIRVRANGKYRNYFFRYLDQSGKVRDMALGSASKTPIIEVKQKAYFFRTLLSVAGQNPSDEPRKRPLFKDYSMQVIELLAGVKLWKNPSQLSSWKSSIANYCNPFIGEKFVDEITKNDVLKILHPIWIEKTMTASRLRGRLEKIFSYAIHDGLYSGANPASWRGNLDMFLPSPRKCSEQKHFSSLSFSDLRALIPKLMDSEATAAKALLFGVLTATRSVEFTQTHWNEISWKDQVWICPASRRKDGKLEPFRVPLSKQACAILKSLKKGSKGCFIFSVDDKSPIRRETPRKFLRTSLGLSSTMHGMRSTFRDWCAENNIDATTAEKCLMHSTGNETVSAYQRSDLLEQRRAILQQWADALFESEETTERKS